jgi:transcriptional regulator with XRE-family HTH domain
MRNEEYLQAVGMLFRLERTRQRLTQQELADKSKVHKKTINVIENAQESSGILTLKKVADGLGKPLSDFV